MIIYSSRSTYIISLQLQFCLFEDNLRTGAMVRHVNELFQKFARIIPKIWNIWASIPKVVGSIPTVARHIFLAFPVWIYTQSNITSI
jgi:hypothetical protein